MGFVQNVRSLHNFIKGVLYMYPRQPQPVPVATPCHDSHCQYGSSHSFLDAIFGHHHGHHHDHHHHHRHPQPAPILVVPPQPVSVPVIQPQPVPYYPLYPMGQVPPPVQSMPMPSAPPMQPMPMPSAPPMQPMPVPSAPCMPGPHVGGPR